MDVGDPSNFARIIDLYKNSVEAIRKDISGARYNDQQINAAMKACYQETGYLLDPHGACGYLALEDGLKADEVGIFLETAHPAKFLETVENSIGEKVAIPQKLQEFMKGTKQSIELSKEFAAFKSFLMKI